MMRTLLLALAMAILGAAAAQAQSSGTLQVHIRHPGVGAASESLLLPHNKAAVIHLPIDAAEVMVTNPAIAEAAIRTPRRAYLLGMTVGQTNAFFFDADGNLILDLDIRVERDLRGLQDMLHRLTPGARITAEAVNDHIVLTGSAPNAASADTALQLARRWAGDEDRVLSMLAIEGREQVMLRVRIVEMQRTIVRQLGINLGATGQYDQVNFSIATQNEFSLVGRFLNGLTGQFSYTNPAQSGAVQTAEGLLQALERVGLVRTLAEPNLTAITGESANFLAGGEFPVPVGRDRDGNITVEFKPFGVGLGFTPVVLSEGRISMRISTEVSELTNQGALQMGQQVVRDEDGNVIGTVPGVTIQGLNVRRAETTVELPSGGSLVLAGLIQEETRQNLDAVPGIHQVPVLGALFRSRDYENRETELVIIVTPYLVDPTRPSSLATPADGFAAASEVESFFFGHINRVYGVSGSRTAERRWNGPVGFIIE
ncbi:MAG: type II and III secretion system protein family protein [Maricaulaceae bacterium]|nr:type II and III secretion system protein family protein [Maricaulaceae bacterium]